MTKKRAVRSAVPAELPPNRIPCQDPDCEFKGETSPCTMDVRDYMPDGCVGLSEPEECESCGEREESMDWCNGDSAWYCTMCGHAHAVDGPYRVRSV